MAEATRAVTVLYLTDVHARVEPESRGIATALRGLIPPPANAVGLTLGLAAIEPLVVREKEASGDVPVLFINCGNLVGIEMVHDWAGGGLVTLAAFEAMVERAGIEHCYSVVGNHEMDFGVEGFRRLQGAARRFRFLAGNLAIDGAPQSAPLEIVSVGGLRIALVTLTVELTCIDAPAADNRGRLGVVEPVAAAEATLAEVRARKAAGEIDLAIGVVHLWDHQDVLVAGIEGIDLLLGGHSHVFHSKVLGAQAIEYRKAGCHAQALGTVRLEVAGDGARVTRSWLLPGAGAAPGSSVSEVFSAALARIREEHPERFRVVARVTGLIDGADRIRSRECPIGRLVAEMILETARRRSDRWVSFAFINGGNVRQNILGTTGEVLATDLHAVVPYGNEILLVDAGREVALRVLHNFVACAVAEPSGFLQFAGIRFRVDARGAVHDVEIEVPGAGSSPAWCPLDRVDVVRLATIDYLVREEGGHHYRFLGDRPVVATGQRLADAWLEGLDRAAVAGAGPLELKAPGSRCVTLDDGFRHTDEQEILATVDAGAGGRLAWVTERRTRSKSDGVRPGA